MSWRTRLRTLFRKEKLDADMSEEMRVHLELQARENIARGMAPDEARYAAQRSFGGMEQIKEEARDQRGWAWLEHALRDLRYAARHLRKTPGFTAVAVLSLAVGIGATTRIFGALDQTLLRELAVREPEALVRFHWLAGVKGARPPTTQDSTGGIDPATGLDVGDAFSHATFDAFHEHHEQFTEIFAFTRPPGFTLEIGGQVETASGQVVSGNYYTGLGAVAGQGRTILPDDDQPNAAPVTVLSYACWQRRFGGVGGVVGRTIRVNRVAVTVVGIMPQEFADPVAAFGAPAFSFPLSMLPLLDPEAASKRAPGFWWLRIMGRLRPGVSVEQGTASLQRTFEESTVGGVTGRNDPMRLLGRPGGHGLLDARRKNAQPLFVLGGLTGLLALAACANVANLLLARGATRRREIAVRLALGASRGRLIRQLMVESVLLAALGAGVGVALAQWSLAIPFPGLGGAAGLDSRLVVFAAGTALLTSLAFGLAPAMQATRLDLTTEFHGGGRLVGRGAHSRLARCLMVLQVALSVVLLVGAGLFARTLRNLEAVDIGFNRSNLLLFAVNPAAAGFTPLEFAQVHASVHDALAARPEVRAVSYSYTPVLANNAGVVNRFEIPGRPSPPGGEGVAFNPIGPDFFATMGIPLLLGRAIDERDVRTNAKVAVVNEAFVKKYFGGQNPLGRLIVLRGEREIVGVAGNVQQGNLRAPTSPTVYLPFEPDGSGWANFAVRTIGEPATALTALRQAMRAVSADLPLNGVWTQERAIEYSLDRERTFARLSVFFGVSALALACIGLYGLTSYAVTRRTAEIGLRMALGALPHRVGWMLLGESLALVSAGLGLGIVVAAVAVRLVASMLYGLSPTDPLTYGGVALLLVVVALLACLLPARRAAKVDPMVALRAE